MTLVWRPVDEAWLLEPSRSFRPHIPAVASFPSIGWAMLADDQADPARFLVFKNGLLAANHSHLDLEHVSVGLGETMSLADLIVQVGGDVIVFRRGSGGHAVASVALAGGRRGQPR